MSKLLLTIMPALLLIGCQSEYKLYEIEQTTDGFEDDCLSATLALSTTESDLNGWSNEKVCGLSASIGIESLPSNRTFTRVKVQGQTNSPLPTDKLRVQFVPGVYVAEDGVYKEVLSF
jgi:hypothetical protein